MEREVDTEHTPAFVLAAEGWHPGVVGIVASRVVERYGRPTFLVAFEGDIGKGSGRSISDSICMRHCNAAATSWTASAATTWRLGLLCGATGWRRSANASSP